MEGRSLQYWRPSTLFTRRHELSTSFTFEGHNKINGEGGGGGGGGGTTRHPLRKVEKAPSSSSSSFLLSRGWLQAGQAGPANSQKPTPPNFFLPSLRWNMEQGKLLRLWGRRRGTRGRRQWQQLGHRLGGGDGGHGGDGGDGDGAIKGTWTLRNELMSLFPSLPPCTLILADQQHAGVSNLTIS